ncbi:MAG TPA: flagellar protein FlgN [Chloroflexota bacterium]|jgi:flagellar biosynthesis/type III secretory pathway chaperone|nr:flagellar protein FlgN [Chloroflexota bacterium]
MAAATSSSDVSPLVTILSREQSIYNQLLDVAEEERGAIVDRNLTELKSVLQRKQELLARLSDLEDRRILWLHRYARAHELDVERATLATIIDTCPPVERKRLGKLHAALRGRVQQVVEVNRVTTSLLHGILKSIDASLRFLLADDGAGPTYGAQGRLHDGVVAGRQLLEARA